MSGELDHVFICVSKGGNEADQLSAFGLTEGTPNTHPGQGTACRRFFFANAYLELLWVNEESEARSPTTRPTHLWERWAGLPGGTCLGTCPFGIGFRPVQREDKTAPFNTWLYHPQYLPAEMNIQVATNASVLTEPMLFHMSFGRRPDAHPNLDRTSLQHRASLSAITRLGLVSPHADRLSPELEAIANAGLAQVRSGPEFLVELGFGGESRGQRKDFNPSLPLVFFW